ncbi:cytochrome b5-like heme/steroid binding domain-containing protein, partial [Tribonema minus]
AEVRQHKTPTDVWCTFRGRVYNMSPFLHQHPGGPESIMRAAGGDMTPLFEKYHRWVNADALIGHLCVGVIAPDE